MAKKNKLGGSPKGVDSFLESYLARRKELSSDKAKSVTNFESRIQDPSKYIDRGNNNFSTHYMTSFEADGKYFAAPSIVEIDGKLVELKGKEILDYAMKTGEYKEFSSDAKAKEYAEGGYKVGTPMESFEYLGRKKIGPSVNAFLRTRNKK